MRVTALVVAVPVLVIAIAASYYYVTFASLIDVQLHGERVRVQPRIFARPLELRVGQALSARQLVDRLNDLGYTERPTIEKPGEFIVEPTAIAISPRSRALEGKTVRVL